MAELYAWSGDDPQKRWRRAFPEGPVTLGRKAGACTWVVPWDRLISGIHATLSMHEGKLQVRKEPRAINPIYYQGQPHDEFTLEVGEQFSIGETTFVLQDESEKTLSEVPPRLELSASSGELARATYIDPGTRIEALSSLPEMIRYSPSDAELEDHVLAVLLRGIPQAEAAALVCLHSVESGEDAIIVRRETRRGGKPAGMRPSRRLVRKAIRERRGVLHGWGAAADASAMVTVSVEFNWALCVPLPDEPTPGWALYVAGRRPDEAAAAPGPTSDLKFAELVAQILGALRQVRDLQKRRTTLERFFSRPVLAALAGNDMDEVLRARPADVTVLMCDLRGSCRMAEEAESHLPGLWERVSEALSIMTTNIIDRDGVIGDFQGDAAMGFWGWPLADSNQVEQAARAALGIRRDFLRAAAKADHPLHAFSCGLGLAHGASVAGRLGTSDQFKVGVFGPAVNRAARLESMTKFFKAPILLDEAVAGLLDPARIGHWARLRRLARVRPYGMSHVVVVHELLPPAVEPDAMPERDRRDYESGLEAFLASRWGDARELLGRLPHDGPAAVLLRFMESHGGAPPANWDGVMNLEAK
jgi:adenylate cyclase